ncbi:MAG: grpE, partial [Microvirga sp.]|nr:grpE [Microvirga sp.]
MKPNDTEHQNAAPQADSPAETTDTAAVDPVVTLEAERNELKDKFLRLMADMENLRRRTEREVADARAYAVANFARDMLNVADNVRRGIENVPDEARESAEGAFKALLEGIDLTERDLQKTLERHGVKKLDPLGQKFDPHVHQAMFEVPNADVPSGTVVQVVQSGYV